MKRRGGESSGFSLIELLVVVMLIAIITALALPALSNYFRVSIQSATRELASIVKEAYNATIVSGKTYRVSYSIADGSFWVEEGPADLVLETEESREREARRKRLFFTEKKEESPFHLAKKVTAKKLKLPRGVRFVAIYTEASKDPITVGEAHTHILPQGLTEATLIQLEDTSNHQMTLVLDAVMGNSRLIPGHYSREDLEREDH